MMRVVVALGLVEYPLRAVIQLPHAQYGFRSNL